MFQPTQRNRLLPPKGGLLISAIDNVLIANPLLKCVNNLARIMRHEKGRTLLREDFAEKLVLQISEHLLTRIFLVSDEPTLADLCLFTALHQALVRLLQDLC